MRTGERPDRGPVQVDEPREEPGRPPFRQVAAEPACESSRPVPLEPRHEDTRCGEGGEAADVVRVQVGQHDPPHARRLDAERRELGCDLVVAIELEPREPEERLPARKVSGLRSTGLLAGIEETDATVVLDRERVHRKRLVGPTAREPAAHPAWVRLGTDDTCRQTVNAHGQATSSLRAGAVRVVTSWPSSARPRAGMLTVRYVDA